MATKTVLIVEQYDSLREYFAEVIQYEGFTPLVADDGLVALERATSHQPDLILSEVLLSTMDGLTLLQAIRDHQSTADIPFVFITSEDSLKIKSLAIHLGANGYLLKPISLKQLRALLTTYLKVESTSTHAP